MTPLCDPSHVGERCHQTNRPVSAHPQISNIVEEDYACCGFRIYWITEKSPDDDLRSPRLTNHATPKIIKFSLKPFQANR